ncbi:MAG: proline dehydrogenase family protein, partial [Desulfobacterales bacterium]
MNDTNQIVEEAIELAGKWQTRARELLTRHERIRQRKFARLFESSADKIILTKLIDQGFRCADNRRTADQIHYLLTEYGIPGFFSFLEKKLMESFIYAGRFFPETTVPVFIERMRLDSDHLIIPGEADAIQAFLQKRKNQGLRVNINYIGEEVSGEKEARSRLDMYLSALENPAIEYVSVKISTIYSQIQPLAFEHTVDILKDRLSDLYRAAALNQFVQRDGSRVDKFVNLDMEAYRDLEITQQTFIRTLEQ